MPRRTEVWHGVPEPQKEGDIMASVMYQKELPVYRTVDVLVMGAGSAGVCAAVAAFSPWTT
jgi:ribulose 1,5-bisphosphate synthetase/thiazole synthase